MDNNNPEMYNIPNNERDGLATIMEERFVTRKRTLDPRCCIYEVPELFRKESEECYRPSAVSIGPAYYEDEKLQSMQKLKWNILERFLQLNETSLDTYIGAVRVLNQEIRSRYEETLLCRIDDDEEFVQMVVLDAVFIICFFMWQVHNYDPIPAAVHPDNLTVLMLIAKRDMFLEENQLPFFVLQVIYSLAFPAAQRSTLIRLACEFIKTSSVFPGFVDVEGYPYPGVDFNVVRSSDVAHLIDLWRMGFSSSVRRGYRHEVKDFHFPKTAKQLSAAGVTFKKSEDRNPLSVQFNPKNGELQFPPFVVDTRTEAFLRNALIFEHCHYWSKGEPYFINLFFFLDSLIDNAEDIQLLTESGILKNLIGSEKRAANFFNDITKYLDIANVSYDLTYLSQDLNTYANKSWNQHKAVLRRKYFRNPWTIISVIYLIVILILTALQAISGII